MLMAPVRLNAIAGLHRTLRRRLPSVRFRGMKLVRDGDTDGRGPIKLKPGSLPCLASSCASYSHGGFHRHAASDALPLWTPLRSKDVFFVTRPFGSRLSRLASFTAAAEAEPPVECPQSSCLPSYMERLTQPPSSCSSPGNLTAISSASAAEERLAAIWKTSAGPVSGSLLFASRFPLMWHRGVLELLCSSCRYVVRKWHVPILGVDCNANPRHKQALTSPPPRSRGIPKHLTPYLVGKQAPRHPRWRQEHTLRAKSTHLYRPTASWLVADNPVLAVLAFMGNCIRCLLLVGQVGHSGFAGKSVSAVYQLRLLRLRTNAPPLHEGGFTLLAAARLKQMNFVRSGSDSKLALAATCSASTGTERSKTDSCQIVTSTKASKQALPTTATSSFSCDGCSESTQKTNGEEGRFRV
ncbi:hypothetical protein Efla_005769 [Eimeria flavescens]